MDTQSLIMESERYIRNGGKPRHNLDRDVQTIIHNNKNKKGLALAEEFNGYVDTWSRNGSFSKANEYQLGKKNEVQNLKLEAQRKYQKKLDKMPLRSSKEYKALKDAIKNDSDTKLKGISLKNKRDELNKQLYGIKGKIQKLLDKEEPDFNAISSFEAETKGIKNKIDAINDEIADNEAALKETGKALKTAKIAFMKVYHSAVTEIYPRIAEAIDTIISCNEELELIREQAEGNIPVRKTGTMFPLITRIEMINGIKGYLEEGSLAYQNLIEGLK